MKHKNIYNFPMEIAKSAAHRTELWKDSNIVRNLN